jgi:hypothetical protein
MARSTEPGQKLLGANCYDLHPRGDEGKRNHFGGSSGTVEGLRHSNHAVVT